MGRSRCLVARPSPPRCCKLGSEALNPRHLSAPATSRPSVTANGQIVVPRGVKFVPADVAALVQAYRNGESAAQVAERCGVSSDTVERFLKTNGVTMREGGLARRPLDQDEVARM